MSKIIHSLPAPAKGANLSFGLGEELTKRGGVAVSPDLNDVCDYLGDRVLSELRRDREMVAPENRDAFKLDVIKLNDGVHNRLAVTREDFQRVLAARKEALGVSMLKWPREQDEELEDYCERLRLSGDNDYSRRMYMIGQIMAHLLRMQSEERDARRRVVEAQKEQERDARRELERSASPDRVEIKRLLSRIESASDGEKFLANIMAALEAHHQAEDARKKLRDIFRWERDACAQLGKRAPSRDIVPDAPQGAHDFATVVNRANAPAPRVYSDGNGNSPSMRRG